MLEGKTPRERPSGRGSLYLFEDHGTNFITYRPWDGLGKEYVRFFRRGSKPEEVSADAF